MRSRLGQCYITGASLKFELVITFVSRQDGTVLMNKEISMSCIRYILAIMLIAPGICWCQDMSPGLWQISVQAQSAAFQGMAPLQVSQCLTAEDAKDPSKLMGTITSPEASSCTYLNKSYSGNTFHFNMECAGTFAIKATGDVSFTSITFSGTISTFAAVNGQQIEMSNSVSALRTGDCDSAR